MRGNVIRLRFLCPLCNKWSFVTVPKPGYGVISSIAFDHGDHVVVVDYDSYGNIRSVETIPVATGFTGEKVQCERCGREVIVPQNPIFRAFAYVHDDHVVLVYIIEGGFYMLAIVDLYKEDRIPSHDKYLIKAL